MTIQVQGLVKDYGRRRVVDHLDLSVSAGEIVGLLGPNGAGKTTTFHMIVGLIAPLSGQILLGEEDITQMPMYRRARAGIGYLSQEPSVFRKLTVSQNLMAVLETLPFSHDEQIARSHELLAELGLEHLADSRADQLSGGEARRLEICRALTRDPQFLLLDEPFSGIDPKAVEDIQSIVSGLKSRHIGVLITDHNVRETLAITDRSYILSDGRILASGTAQDLASNSEVRRVYLGERFRLD